MRRIVNSSGILPGANSHPTPSEAPVTPTARREYTQTIRQRYAQVSRAAKRALLTEFCATTGYHRKYAIALLNRPAPLARTTRHRPARYRPDTVTILAAIWEAAGYPWSARLKALLPLWLPWARRAFASPRRSAVNSGRSAPARSTVTSRRASGRYGVGSTAAPNPAPCSSTTSPSAPSTGT